MKIAKKGFVRLLIILCVFVQQTGAQSPQGVSYQAVLSDDNGLPLENTPVNIRFTILSGATEVYREEHVPTTDKIGKLEVIIGQGSILFGDFDAIDWSSGDYEVEVEIDNGSGYEPAGTNTVWSVFYALHAATADSIAGVDISNIGNQNLQLSGSTLSIEGGNSVDLSAVVGQPGPVGPQGPDGPQGPQGPQGDPGSGIVNTIDNGDGTLTFEYGDGSTFITPDLTGPAGSSDDDQTLTLTGVNLSIEDGNAVNLSAFLDDTDDQTLNLNGANLAIQNGNAVSLSGFLDNTDDQNLTGATLAGTTLQIDIENGTSASVDLASLQGSGGTDDQTLILTGTNLSIEDGNTVDLSVVQDGTGTDDQNLTLSGNTLSIEDGNSVDLSIYEDNTDAQTLSVSGTSITISGGNTISLPPATGTDDQVLTLNGTDLTIEDGNTIDLAPVIGVNDEIVDADSDTKVEVEKNTDEDLIRFTTNGFELARFNSKALELNATGNSVFLGKNAGNADNGVVGGNVYLGYESGVYNDHGGNVFIGKGSGKHSLSAHGNVFIGSQAGLANDQGDQNVYLGWEAGAAASSGYRNVYLGYSSGSTNTTGNNNVFIGFEAGQSSSGSNKLYIENSNSNTPLIYGEFNTNMVRINGELQVSDPSSGGFALPSADGTVGQVMQTDGAGSLSWVDVTSATNTDDQVLTLNGTDLSIEDGNTVDLSSVVGTSDAIVDTDADTKVEVEQNPDEDVIRFTTGGQQIAMLDDKTFHLNAVGSNVFIGDQVGRLNSSGIRNVFTGYRSGYDNTTGSYNVFLGTESGTNNTTGRDNVFIGKESGYSNTTGNYNVFIGANSGFNSTNSAEKNVFIGFNSGRSATGSNMLYIENSNSNSPLIYGEFDNDIIRINGELQVSDPTNGGFALPSTDGTVGQVMQTDGNGNVTWGNAGAVNTDDQQLTLSGTDLSIEDGNTIDLSSILGTSDAIVDTDTDTKVEVEQNPDEDVIRFTTEGYEIAKLDGKTFHLGAPNNNLFMGRFSGQNISSGQKNVFIGASSGNLNSTGSSNVFLGCWSGISNTTGNSNIFVGNESGLSNTTGSSNLFTGFQSGYSNTTGYENLFFGAGSGLVNTVGHGNVFLGHESGRTNVNGDDNVFIGHQSGYTNTSGIGNVFLGLQSGVNNVSGNFNVFLGYKAGYNETNHARLYIENSDSNDPLIYGEFDNDIVRINGAFQINDPASGGFALPSSDGTVGQTLQTDGSGVLTWTDPSSSDELTDADADTKVEVEKNADEDIIRFTSEGHEVATLDKNTFHLESESGENVFVGKDAGIVTVSTATHNAFFGSRSGEANTDGSRNAFFGIHSGFGNATGSDNVFLGYQAGFGNWSGNRNTYIGTQAGWENGLGNRNVFIGYKVGGNGISSPVDDRLVIDNSNTNIPLVVGDFVQNKLGINWILTAPIPQALSVNGNASKAAAGDWLANSDERLKKNIQNLNPEEVLNRLMQMQGVSYEWNDTKTGLDRPEGIQYGFVAQDIQKLFPELVEEDDLGYLMTAYGTYDAFYIEAIKALVDRIEDLESEKKALQATNQRVEDRLTDIENRLRSMTEKTESKR